MEPHDGKSHLQIRKADVGLLSEQDIKINYIKAEIWGLPIRGFYSTAEADTFGKV